MRLFGFGKKKSYRGRRQAKPLKKILDEAFAREVSKDPDLKRQLAFKEAGHPELLERDKETENHKKEIKKYVTTQALTAIQEDPDLAKQFVEAEIENILTGGKPGRYHRAGDGNYFPESGESGLELALDQIDSLNNLREKLTEMGLIEGKGGGFWAGMTMKDLMGALPVVASLLGKGQPINGEVQGEVQRTFVVKIDGHDRELPENEYRALLKDGKITPVAGLVEPAPIVEEKELSKESVVDEPTALVSNEQAANLASFDLSPILDTLDPEVIGAYLDMTPDEFVVALKDGVDANEEIPMVLWGFFGNTDYEGVVKYLTPYRDKEEWSVTIERILSDDGKIWVEQAIELVKEARSGE